MRKRIVFSALVAASLLSIATGCGTEAADQAVEPVNTIPINADGTIEPQNLLQGASKGDWCGNSDVGDSAYLWNRQVGAFKCAATALCSIASPAAAIACSVALTSLLETYKDNPSNVTMVWGFIVALAQYGYLDLTTDPHALQRVNPQLWASLVAAYGDKGAQSFTMKVMNIIFKFDQRTLPLDKVSKVTYVGLLASCAEAIRGLCDLAVNSVYAAQESYEAWVAPDFIGSVPGCSKSTAVAVTDHTYAPWDSAETTFNKCVGECRKEQDSCGGDSQKQCGWWNACVNYCASDKLGNWSSPLVSGYRMVCQPSQPTTPTPIPNAAVPAIE